MERKTLDIVYFIILGICLVALVYLIMLMRGEGGDCLKNPYIYGASKMGNVECNCVQHTNKLCPPKFFFNDTGFDTPVTRCDVGEKIVYPKIDWGALNLTVE